MIRLDKFLGGMNIGTRSQAKKLIRDGQVTVNGLVVKKPETKVDEDNDIVLCGGRKIIYSKYSYYMLYKPAGCVSATSDENDMTVMDYVTVENKEGLFPVGRLDKDTEGLLIITDDGKMAHNLLSPKKHVQKTYYAELDKAVTDETAGLFLRGIDIGDDRPALPAKLDIMTPENGGVPKVYITITEGRYHQVKRMFEAAGCRVMYLKRISMGGIVLDDSLRPGEFRKLNDKEIELLNSIS